jgi:hypothetical protein
MTLEYRGSDGEPISAPTSKRPVDAKADAQEMARMAADGLNRLHPPRKA